MVLSIRVRHVTIRTSNYVSRLPLKDSIKSMLTNHVGHQLDQTRRDVVDYDDDDALKESVAVVDPLQPQPTLPYSIHLDQGEIPPSET